MALKRFITENFFGMKNEISTFYESIFLKGTDKVR